LTPDKSSDDGDSTTPVPSSAARLPLAAVVVGETLDAGTVVAFLEVAGTVTSGSAGSGSSDTLPGGAADHSGGAVSVGETADASTSGGALGGT
jgi:hypothetical protein